ncbi:MAG: hypothetical protein EOP02_23515 [Proteobacteria bacterium]|nr:MAG: hypothetical protein EOP02_23515 [Pseudomonadota bacterium]
MFVSLPTLPLSYIRPYRPSKGWLVISQYYNTAEQGRLEPVSA